MAKLFGVDIASLVHKNMSAGLLKLTIKHYTPGTRTATDPTAGTNPTDSTHQGRGFYEEYADRQIDGKLVRAGDRKIIVIAKSVKPSVSPVPGDEIHVAGSAQAAGTVVDAQPAATPGYEVSAVVRIAALEQELLLGANQVPLQQIDLPYSIPELTSPHLPGA